MKRLFALSVSIAGLQHDVSCPGVTVISLAVIRRHLAEQRVTLGKRDDAQESRAPADALASSLLLLCSQL